MDVFGAIRLCPDDSGSLTFQYKLIFIIAIVSFLDVGSCSVLEAVAEGPRQVCEYCVFGIILVSSYTVEDLLSTLVMAYDAIRRRIR